MDNQRFNEWVEREFPTTGHMVYANHAAISPWPRSTCEAVQAFATENLETGPLRIGRWLAREKALRNRIASMLNADSGNDIALLKNTSEGICLVANGMQWRAGDNVVTPAGEFISNRMPWDALAAQGVEVRTVKINKTGVPEQDLAAAMDKRTRLLTVSSVQWDTGFRLDLETLGEICAERGVFFFVDAIQQFGAHRIDVRGSRINALCASAHKWQMGPEGIALFYCDEATRDGLGFSQLGWKTLEDPFEYDRPGRMPAASARRFEAGSPNTLGQAALDASLSLIEEVGLSEVERRVHENTGRLVRCIVDLPALELRSSTDPERYSGIVSLEPTGTDAEALRAALSRLRCFAGVRGSYLRLSPHFYQHGRMMDRLLESLVAVSKK